MFPNSPNTASSSDNWGSDLSISIAGSSSSSPRGGLWKKFEGKPPIPGFLTNVVVMFRESFERKKYNEPTEPTCATLLVAENSSKIRQKALAYEICNYLLNNGLDKLQVLSNFSTKSESKTSDESTELQDLKNRWDAEVIREDLSGANPLPSSLISSPNGTSTSFIYGNIEVTIIILTSCTGTWQQHRMWELLRDGYEMSSLGVIIIGDADLLTQYMFDPDWKNLAAFLKDPEMSGIEIKDHLEIYCSKHQVINKKIVLWEELHTQAPGGGCINICGEMNCGHYCPHICHRFDKDHQSKELRCSKPCNRVCPYGHYCTRLCGQQCGRCLHVVNIPVGCPHQPGKESQTFCYQRHTVQYCEKPVRKRLRCGHQVNALCSQDITNIRCKSKVTKRFPCGHQIQFKCFQKPGHVQDNLKCEKPCRRRLDCGHMCPQLCHISEDPNHETFQCLQPCEKLCARKTHPCPLSGKHPCSDPCPPECQEIFRFKLDCGHEVEIICSDQDPNQEDYFCEQPCLKYPYHCRHPCEKLCGEDCGQCEVLVSKLNAGCDRGHRSKVKCHEIPSTPCAVQVIPLRVTPECGHVVYVECHQANRVTVEDLAEICKEPCNERFDKDERECGHACQGTCGDCFQGRFHARCNQPCGKILICGHSCTNPCGMACPPCRYPCMNSCEHSKCEYECGVPCTRTCEQPCVYTCEHSACSKKCSEVCDKPVCNEPCPELLECGHPCVGFCGEECPKYCRICSPDKLLAGSLSGDVDDDSRFIYLPDCGHCVESNDFEQWLKLGSNPEDEILPIRCPICTQRIYWIRRYSQIFDENQKMVNSVRQRIYGNMEEIERVLKEIEEKIQAHKEEAGSVCFSEYADYILNEFTWGRFAEPDLKEMEFLSVSLEKANFLNWVATEWINCSEVLTNLKDKLPEEEYERLAFYWEKYLYEMIADRGWPLHKNEMIALYRERERMDDTVALFSRMDITGRNGRDAITAEAQRIFDATEILLRQNRPYSDETRENFRRNLTDLDSVLKYTLNITERERRQIVLAFGEGSGRWFKCVNGHVYVVTECGGATEMGRCNECGAPIGGFNHVLVERNYLATEMDGAEQPLYPTVLNRPRNIN